MAGSIRNRERTDLRYEVYLCDDGECIIMDEIDEIMIMKTDNEIAASTFVEELNKVEREDYFDTFRL